MAPSGTREDDAPPTAEPDDAGAPPVSTERPSSVPPEDATGPRLSTPPPSAPPPSRVSIHTRAVELDPERLRDDVVGGRTPVPLLDDGFEVLELIGRGGMGEVLAAQDKQLRRVVAVKVIHPEAQADQALEQRFYVEAQVGAQLEHPHIVPFYTLERTAEGRPAFAMRLVEGETYEQYLDRARAGRPASRGRGARFSLERRLEPLLRIAEALHYAHARGVCHRDVKPENVMLGSYGEVYLMDWGVARVTGQEDATASGAGAVEARTASGGQWKRMTQPGQVLGTVTYMAPEQAVGDLSAHGPATDQFALGMMLQEAATLRPPRGGKNPVDSLGKAAVGERAPARRGEIPPPLAAIIARATQRKPEDRYPTTRDLAEDLAHFIRGEPVSVHPEGPLRRGWRGLSAHPAIVLAVFLVLSGFLVLSLMETLRAERSRIALAERTAAVAARSHAIDTQLERVRALVVGLGAEIEALTADGAPRPGLSPAVSQADFQAGRGPTDTAPLARYGQPVSFLQPMSSWPRGVPEAEVAPTAARMTPLTEYFRRLLWRGARDAPEDLVGPRAQADWLRAHPSFVHVTYVAFENGLLLNYPGYGELADGYDARRRPWYVQSRDAREPRWGVPYPDASGSGILVPCNVAVHGPDGALLGIAGADLILDDLLRLLDAPGVPGWRASALLSLEGEPIVTSEDKAQRLGQGLHGDAAYESRGAVPDTLRAAVRARATNGRVALPGGGSAIYDALEAIDWVYVAEFDD